MIKTLILHGLVFCRFLQWNLSSPYSCRRLPKIIFWRPLIVLSKNYFQGELPLNPAFVVWIWIKSGLFASAWRERSFRSHQSKGWGRAKPTSVQPPNPLATQYCPSSPHSELSPPLQQPKFAPHPFSRPISASKLWLLPLFPLISDSTWQLFKIMIIFDQSFVTKIKLNTYLNLAWICYPPPVSSL